MLIFVQTLKANLKTNKNALSLAKRNQIKTRPKKAKAKFSRSFLQKQKQKMTFQKCSKYY